MIYPRCRAEIRAGLFKNGDYNMYEMVPEGSKDEKKFNLKACFRKITLKHNLIEYWEKNSERNQTIVE